MHDDAFIEQVLTVIRSTRQHTFPHWGKTVAEKKKTDSAVDVVTKLDYQVEEELAKEFNAIDPSIAFVGEEGGGNRNAERFWLVDPIDGTGLFIRGLPGCTTMVALIENDRPTFSAIYDFTNDTLYHAVLDGGAFANGHAIHVNNRSLEWSYMCVEINLSLPGNIELREKLRSRSMLLQYMSSGWEFAMVASGKLEARIGKDPFGKDYDFAPGCLLVKEAGGIVTNIGSRSYDYKNVDYIAANPPVHNALTEGSKALFPVK